MRISQFLILTAIFLVATVPFVDKAFHIDDALYLTEARQILNSPLDPLGGEILWEKEPEAIFDANFNPPLWNYLMAGVLSVTGEPSVVVGKDEKTSASRTPEIALHILEDSFVFASLIAAYLLMARWTRWPMVGCCLLVMSPAWLPGMNVMLEGPVMAFWLWGTWTHLKAVETGKTRWIVLTGILAALGIMTKYTCGALVVVLLVHCLTIRFWRGLWYVAPVAVALTAWSMHNWLVYDRIHLFVIFSRMQTGERVGDGVKIWESWGRVFALVRLIGSATLISVPLLWSIMHRRSSLIVCSVVILAGVIGVVGALDLNERLFEMGLDLTDRMEPALLTRYSGWNHAVGFGVLGAATLIGLAATARYCGEGESKPAESEKILWIWFGAMALFCILAVPFLAVRHFLPGMLPLVVLMLRRIEAYDSWSTSFFVYTTTAIGSLIGLMVAHGDYVYAEWYRRTAVDVAGRSVVQANKKEVNVTVWYTGHWGWAYYADRAGLKPFMESNSTMKNGDLLLLPLIMTWKLPDPLKPPGMYLRNVQNISAKPKTTRLTPKPTFTDNAYDFALNGVRTVSNITHYYGGGTNNLPWRFSMKPLDDFIITEYSKPESEDRDKINDE